MSDPLGKQEQSPDEASPEKAPGDRLLPPAAFVDLEALELEREVGLKISEEISRKAEGVAIGCPEEGRLSVVVSDPEAIWIYELIELDTRGEYKAVLLRGDPNWIQLAQEYIYRVRPARQRESWREWLQTKRLEGAELAVKRSEDDGEQAEVTGAAVTRAERIIREAIAAGASDIHLEMFPDTTLIRYRQDGVLGIVDEVGDRKEARALVKRLKVLAQMDVSNSRVTQGGRISLAVGDRGYDLRVSIVPVPAGESVVMRILSKGAFNVSLPDLGLDETHLKLYRSFIQQPYGMVLTCGPTGSGKSTTLYASLKSIARPDRKLLTVEDPIEYEMPGIIQVAVNTAPREPEKRVTFGSALREFLRQDPDVILVGEIRDEETARISIQAALTGHLLFSTIHTNDVVGIINRLKDMGVKPYLVASTLIGGVAQRLIRRVCPECAEPVDPTPEQLHALQSEGLEDIQLRRGRGCAACRRTGYKGRVGLFEVLKVTDRIRDMIEQEATGLHIAQAAQEEGMTTVRLDGLAKAAAGIVTFEEVQRVCAMDL